MQPTETEMKNVVRNALEGVIHNPPCPLRTHLSSQHVDVEAFKSYFRRTAAIASSVREEERGLAWHVELLDPTEKERVLELALGIYRAPASPRNR